MYFFGQITLSNNCGIHYWSIGTTLQRRSREQIQEYNRRHLYSKVASYFNPVRVHDKFGPLLHLQQSVMRSVSANLIVMTLDS
jgi:hypothetical protein